MVDVSTKEADVTLQARSTVKRSANSPQECAVVKKHKPSEVETCQDNDSSDVTKYSQSIPLFDTNLSREPSQNVDCSPSIPLFNSELPGKSSQDVINRDCSLNIPRSKSRNRSPSILPNESSQDETDSHFSPSIPLYDRKMEKMDKAQKMGEFITQETIGTQNYDSDDDLFGESDNEANNLKQKTKSDSDDSDATFYDAQENLEDERKQDFCDKAEPSKSLVEEISKPPVEEVNKSFIEEIMLDDDWSDFDISHIQKKENISPRVVLKERSENNLSCNDSLRDFKNNNKNFQCFRLNEIENVQPIVCKEVEQKKFRLGLNLQTLKKKSTPNVDTACDKDGFAIPQSVCSKYFSPKPKENKKVEVAIKKKIKKKTRRKARTNFIIDEAEISSDADTSDGSSEHEEDEELEDSFVSYTQNVTDAVDMTAHYMRTVHSPIHGRGFVFKPLKSSAYCGNVYSQPVTQTDNTYVNVSKTMIIFDIFLKTI